MQIYANNMQTICNYMQLYMRKYAKIICKNMHKNANICKIYAKYMHKICIHMRKYKKIICKHMQNKEINMHY